MKLVNEGELDTWEREGARDHRAGKLRHMNPFGTIHGTDAMQKRDAWWRGWDKAGRELHPPPDLPTPAPTRQKDEGV
jgi:hypothetical protein